MRPWFTLPSLKHAMISDFWQMGKGHGSQRGRGEHKQKGEGEMWRATSGIRAVHASIHAAGLF